MNNTTISDHDQKATITTNHEMDGGFTGRDPHSEMAQFDQAIYLKDFPQTPLDVQNLIQFGF